jgi:succinate-acetate transporter protein
MTVMIMTNVHTIASDEASVIVTMVISYGGVCH